MTEPRPAADQPAASKPTPRRRRWHPWRWLAALILLPLLLVLVSYLTLRSPLMEKWLWPLAQKRLADHTGLQIELARLRIDLLGQIQLEGLHITPVAPTADCADFDLRLQSLTLDWQLKPLLQRHLVINQFALRQLDARGCLSLQLDAEPVAPPPTQSSPTPEAQFADLWQTLSQLPLTFSIEQLQLEDLQADVDLRLPAQGLQLRWTGHWELASQLSWQGQQLRGQLQSQLDSAAPLQLIQQQLSQHSLNQQPLNQQQPEQQLELTLHPSFDLDLNWQLHAAGAEINIRQLALQSGAMDLRQQQAEQQLVWQSEGYQLRVRAPEPLLLTSTPQLALALQLEVLSQLGRSELHWQTAQHQLTTQLAHQLQLRAQGELQLDALDPAAWHLYLAQELEVNQLALTLPEGELALEQFTLRLDLEQPRASGQLHASLDQQLQQLSTSWSAPLEQQSFQLSSFVDWHQLLGQLDLALHLNHTPFWTLETQLIPEQQAWQHQLTSHLQLDTALLEWIDASQARATRAQAATEEPRRVDAGALLDLAAWGGWHAQLDLQQQLAYQDTFSMNPIQPEQLQAYHATLDFSLVSSTNQDRLSLAQPLRLQLALDLPLTHFAPQLNWQLDLPALTSEGLTMPLQLAAQSTLAADFGQLSWLDLAERPIESQLSGLQHLEITSQIHAQQHPLLNLALSLQQQPHQLGWQHQLTLGWHPRWLDLLAEADRLALWNELELPTSLWDQLSVLSPVTLEHQLQLALDLPWPHLLTEAAQAWLSDPQWPQQAGLTLDEQLIIHPVSGLDWQLAAPSGWQHQLAWQPETAQLMAQYQVGALNLDQQLQGDALAVQLNLHTQAQAGHPPHALQLNLQGRGDTLAAYLPHILAAADSRATDTPSASPWLALHPLLFPLELNLDAQWDAALTQLQIHDFSQSLGHGWLSHQLEGELQLDGQAADLRGDLRLSPRAGLADQLLALEGSGELRLPWSLISQDQQLFSLQAQLVFDQLHLQLGDWALDDLHGHLQLDQELRLLPDQRLAFAYLLTPEPFQRVDFQQVEPFLGQRPQVRFTQLRSPHLPPIGPLQARLPIQQNLLRLQDFSLGLLGGQMAGHFYLDTRPGAWRIGLLSRIAQVDLRPLLPNTQLSGQAPISARTAIELDLAQRLLEGRIDVTDITRTQLLQLLELIDPDYQEDQINSARSALRLAHPQRVTLAMRYGLLDMDLQLSLFNEPLRLRGLPLTGLIERFAEEALMLPDQLPLEAPPAPEFL